MAPLLLSKVAMGRYIWMEEPETIPGQVQVKSHCKRAAKGTWLHRHTLEPRQLWPYLAGIFCVDPSLLGPLTVEDYCGSSPSRAQAEAQPRHPAPFPRKDSSFGLEDRCPRLQSPPGKDSASPALRREVPSSSLA